MRPVKWIAVLLALSLLAAMVPAALAEELETQLEEMEFTQVEDDVAPAEYAGEDTGLTVEGDEPFEAGEAWTDEEALPVEGAFDDGGEYLVDAPVADGRCYAQVLTEQAQVYSGADVDELTATLAAGETVLVVDASGPRALVAFNAEGSVADGYMDYYDLAALDDQGTAAYLDAAAASAAVALYDGDLNWPLAPLSADSYAGPFSVMATSRYTDLGNDTRFTINGKEIYANMFPDTGAGNCWAWAQKVYQELWGCKFTSTFEGTASTGMNLLRNLSDSERKLTPEHLKDFVENTQLGATIRVASCTSSCSEFQNDGLSCGHKGHSLIIVDKNADGVYTMDSHSDSQHTRFYSWEGFCSSWKNYTYIKYIKWPNAPALPPTQFVDGIGVRDNDATYRVRAIAKNGVNVVKTPMVTTVVATLKTSETFAVTKKSTAKIDGCYWIYGTTPSGVTGWVTAKDELIMDVNDNIPAEKVTLDQTSLLLATGGSVTLKPTVYPVDTTNKAITWKSDDTSIVTVVDGVVTGVKAGETDVTASNDDSGMTRTCHVRVSEATVMANVTKTGSNGTVKLELGKKLQINPAFITVNGWKLKTTTSSKTKIAAIDAKTGIVTSKAIGTTTITLKAKNGKKATLTVKVVKPAATTDTGKSDSTDSAVAPTSVKLNKSGTVTVKKGKKLKLTATLKPANAASDLVWKSSNEKVATVDANGNVTAVKKGTCYVAVKTSNGKLAKVKIKVN